MMAAEPAALADPFQNRVAVKLLHTHLGRSRPKQRHRGLVVKRPDPSLENAKPGLVIFEFRGFCRANCGAALNSVPSISSVCACTYIHTCIYVDVCIPLRKLSFLKQPPIARETLNPFLITASHVRKTGCEQLPLWQFTCRMAVWTIASAVATTAQLLRLLSAWNKNCGRTWADKVHAILLK